MEANTPAVEPSTLDDQSDPPWKSQRKAALQFLTEECFSSKTPADAKLLAVRNCPLLIDEDCHVSSSNILTVLQQLLQKELDMTILRYVGLGLELEV